MITPSYNSNSGCDFLTTYAIVQTGGKQYRVHPGEAVRVESLPTAAGETVELEDVLLVCRDDEVTIGSPKVAGARVTAEVVGHGKGDKVIVFKYKAKTRYRRRNGHRQLYTDLKVIDILL
jgi:large subunit ribosomal protein L21